MSSNDRTFDRDEVALILREAAQLEDRRGSPGAEPAVSTPEVSGDGLTLGEIERAAAEVGIGRSAVGAASLRVALRGAHLAGDRFQLVHEIDGELSDEALERLASDVRSLASPAKLQRTADGLEFEIGTPNGEPGSLIVQVRSKHGGTVISAWSHAPALTAGDMAACALLGIPAFLFPVVATAGGQWPALGPAAAIAAAGAAAATGVTAGVQRVRMNRWREGLATVLVPIAARAAELAGPE
jgi:hypothetical protein